MDEIWKPVPSVPEIMASSQGRVWVQPTKGRMPTGGVRVYFSAPTFGFEDKTATGRADAPKRRILRVGRLRKTFKVHQLICEAFHGPKPFDTAVVLHLDEDPSNNAPENLRWGSRKENQNFPAVKAAFHARSGVKSAWAIHKDLNP